MIMAAMASMAMLPFALLVLLQLFAAVRAADNGLGLTPVRATCRGCRGCYGCCGRTASRSSPPPTLPAHSLSLAVHVCRTRLLAVHQPMGWRNWNFYQGEITQEIMEANMHAMVDKSRTPLGHSEPASLLELGYTHAGLVSESAAQRVSLCRHARVPRCAAPHDIAGWLTVNGTSQDDNWQACGAGVGGSFHAADGTPLINTSRFPSMKSMVATGHRLGLKVGWYDNNCICGEGSARLNATQVAKDVEGNVKYIAEMQFDGLKVGARARHHLWCTQLDHTPSLSPHDHLLPMA